MVVVVRAYYIGDCAGDKRTAIVSTLVNISFFALFADFFTRKYDSGDKTRIAATEKKD